MSVAIVHDYFCTTGGAERVALAMHRAFPSAPLYAGLYDPTSTYPEVARSGVQTLPLNRMGWLRRDYRKALPFLAASFARLRLTDDVVLCSSSGWSHGTRASGRKVVYWYSPPKWLYQSERYRGAGRRGGRMALAALRPYLLRADRQGVEGIHRHLTTSRFIRDQLREVYGCEAEVIPPPHSLDPDGPQEAVKGLGRGFILCVSRLIGYKNLDAVIQSFSINRDARLVLVGSGPDGPHLRRLARGNVVFLDSATDAQLRWLYDSCSGIVSAANEDYGLTPLEAASFGKPSAVLRWGGFLDTVRDGATGLFFDDPEPQSISRAVREMGSFGWDLTTIRTHAETFSEDRYIARMRAVVAEELASTAGGASLTADPVSSIP